jgi:hypothetical protein
MRLYAALTLCGLCAPAIAGTLEPGAFSAQKKVDVEQVITVALRDPDARPSAEHIAGNIRAYDARALAIAALAQDQRVPMEERAVACVQLILDTYYAQQSAAVTEIVFEPSLVGMAYSAGRRGGKLVVGEESLHQMPTMLAAEVLRVGHELQHAEHHLRGLHARKDRHESEFLAYYWEAMADPPAGTGGVARAKRVSWCEEGIRHYAQLGTDQQARYRQAFEELVAVKRACGPAG